jgi:hypothetical protein
MMKSNRSSHQSTRSPLPIQRVVDTLARGWGRAQMRQESEIRSIWSLVLGPERAKNAQVDGLRGSVLYVRVANETMLKEIRLLSEHLVSACNQHGCGSKVKRIQARIGAMVKEEPSRRPRRRSRGVRKLERSAAEAIRKASSVIEDDALRESFQAWLQVQALRNIEEKKREQGESNGKV